MKLKKNVKEVFLNFLILITYNKYPVTDFQLKTKKRNYGNANNKRK